MNRGAPRAFVLAGVGIAAAARLALAAGCIFDRLVSPSLTLTADHSSDRVEIVLADSLGALAVRSAERELRIALGCEDALVDMSIFFHDESELELAPTRLTVRGTAADFRRRSTLKAPKRRSFDDVTLGDLVNAIPAEHGYTGRVAPQLSSLVLEHVDQTAESDLHLLRRLAREFDATAKATGGHLVFAPRGRGRTAGSGRSMPVVDLDPTKVTSARYTIRDRPKYGSVIASYQDLEEGKLVHVTAGSGSPAFHFREPRATKAEAKADAAACLAKFERQTLGLELTLPGEPRLTVKTIVAMRDWPRVGTTRCAAARVVHALSKSRGYTPSVTADNLVDR